MMKASKLLAAALLVGVVATSGPAWAFGRHHGTGMTAASARGSWHHDHRHFRGSVALFVGVPLWPWFTSYPPTGVATPSATYVEQGVPGNAYYCGSAQTYYPAVTDCPEGWQTVSPQP